MQDVKPIDCDVLIVGGGLVGSLLANALSSLSLDVVLVEARSVHSLSQPSFDGRATALANGSQRVLEQLGLWEAIRPEAQPIRDIHIGERGRFGAARISAEEEGVEALGFTVENRVLGAALWDPLMQDAGFRCLSSAEVVDLTQTAAATEARVESADGDLVVRARLTVAADGARSGLRRALGIEARVDDYDQQAIIVNCTTQEPHRCRAFERFTPDGPLALLPLTADRVAVVWTLRSNRAERALGLAEDDFRSALQDAFGFRLGRFERIGRRDSHALHRVRSTAVVRDRTVLIGNAANALHPVAGQGFNLAVRDAAALAEVIASAPRDDVGSPELLERYLSWRTDDQRKLTGFTHALVRGFGAEGVGLDTLRGLGLMAFDLLPGGKSLLARHTMGLAGRVPRLARHLDLV
ncbi:MAG: 2-octaprenyl-6-methoxyphenyl hydroxylase [Gammaproteobacteria bacterium]|jgi:2-octaprenyl-6-methoxyphenol hydroxylase